MLSSHISRFLKNKKRSGTSLEGKYYSCYINWPNYIVWLPLLSDILGKMCVAIACKPGCDVMNFEVKLIFVIKPFILRDEKVVTRT